MTGLVAYIEQDFLRWELFEKNARLPSYSREGVIELMPTSDGDLYAFKYVNGHPNNTRAGRLTVTAFGVLADVHTGYPLLLSEMTLATALRTAATSALAAKHLARKNSQTMAMIGLGAQEEFQALAFKAVLGVRNLRVFDADPAATRKFIANLANSSFTIVAASSVTDAIRSADIVTTATAANSHAAVITPEMIAEGTHFNAIGGDCPGKTEFRRDALLHARIFVEFPPQTRVEGEIQQLDANSPVTELWRVIAGTARGRASDKEVTLFDSVGFAIEDYSTLRFLRDAMNDAGINRDLARAGSRKSERPFRADRQGRRARGAGAMERSPAAPHRLTAPNAVYILAIVRSTASPPSKSGGFHRFQLRSAQSIWSRSGLTARRNSARTLV
jgi:ornithine cyclodeaminase